MDKNKPTQESKQPTSLAYRFLLILGLAVLFYIIVSGVFDKVIGSSFIKKDSDILSSYIKKIHTLNNNLYSAVEKDAFNGGKALSIIPDTLLGLNSLKEEVSSLIAAPSPKDDEQLENIEFLASGLDSNIKFLDQLALCLENPNADDLSTSFTNLTEYRNSCIENYSKVVYKNSQEILSRDGEEFFSLSLAYLNELIVLNRKSNIISSQRNEFLTSIDSIVTEFKKINTDYSEFVKRVRKEDTSYQGIINSIDKDCETFVDIYHELNSISIPSDGLELFKGFEGCMGNYNSYIQSLRKAVYKESEQKGKLTDAELKKLYQESMDEYDRLQASFNSFQEEYSSYKDQ